MSQNFETQLVFIHKWELKQQKLPTIFKVEYISVCNLFIIQKLYYC